jgi:signal transduction histidine kinase
MGCAGDILPVRSIILKLLVISDLLEPTALRFLSSITDVWKFADPEEVKYAQQVRGNDLTTFRLFMFSTLVIAMAFLVVDMTRPVDFFWVSVMRSGLAVFYALILALSYYRQLRSNELQLVTYIIYFAQAFLARMPFFFLTNVLLLFFYTGITVSGLRFRYGLLVNVSVFIAFMIVTRMSGEAFYKSQEPNLLLNLLASIIAGGIIEKQKRKNFRQLAELDLLNQQKAKILSILSHDIASPLQSTSGLLDTYSRQQISREELDLFLPKVKARLEVVSFLVYSLVRWSRSQMEGFKAQKAAVSLNSLIDENLLVIKPSAEEKGIIMRVDCPPGLQAYTDHDMINLILRNLLSNAVKFTPRGKAIMIKAFREESKLLLQVSNEGEPIPDTVHEKLFTFQVKPGQGTANEAGTGLGLAIAHQFALLNGGTIYLEPRLGNENTFCVELQAVQ